MANRMQARPRSPRRSVAMTAFHRRRVVCSVGTPRSSLQARASAVACNPQRTAKQIAQGNKHARAVRQNRRASRCERQRLWSNYCAWSSSNRAERPNVSGDTYIVRRCLSPLLRTSRYMRESVCTHQLERRAHQARDAHGNAPRSEKNAKKSQQRCSRRAIRAVGGRRADDVLLTSCAGVRVPYLRRAAVDADGLAGLERAPSLHRKTIIGARSR